MLCYVFKSKGGRVFRARYRLSDSPKIYDVPLHTHIKEVAEAKARQLVEDGERELAGLLPPKSLRDAAQSPISRHCADFVADLTARKRGSSHLVHSKCRLNRLIMECGWKLLRDISADSFKKWISQHPELSAKTKNEYLASASAFLTWMERNGRVTHNPLKAVRKLEKEATFSRRALSTDEFMRLVQGSGKRSFAYLMAGCTGLRRRELKQLLWSDIHLDTPQPFIDVRAETTKNRKSAIIPLIPQLVDALKKEYSKRMHFTDRIFRRGLPSVTMLKKDLAACGIPVEDQRGYRVDFHALRHTFASLLATSGVSELARVKLSRHSDWRQTDRYTDPKSIPLYGEIQKLGDLLPSQGASLKSGKMGQNEAIPGQAESPKSPADVVPIGSGITSLAKVVPGWENAEMVPRGRLELPC